MAELLARHCAACPSYARFVDDWRRHNSSRHEDSEETSLANYPFIPVTVFKEFTLRSTDGPVMTLNSSATTSDNASRIHVNRETKKRQTRSANRVMNDFIGAERRPYLVFDIEETVRGSASLSARGAAILSLAHHASEFHFVCRRGEGDQLRLDFEALGRAIEAVGEKPFVAYGFTFILYQSHRELIESRFGLPPAHDESVILHSGGWKRLTNIAVDKQSFNETVAGVWDLAPSRVIDFYGTIEQVGVPYPDCEQGYKHAPYWADVIMRRADTLEAAKVGETGLIQLLSALPLSAPNHSVLTEDLGKIVLEDGCSCGRRGKAFVFQGRAPKAETRGCSDVGRH